MADAVKFVVNAYRSLCLSLRHSHVQPTSGRWLVLHGSLALVNGASISKHCKNWAFAFWRALNTESTVCWNWSLAVQCKWPSIREGTICLVTRYESSTTLTASVKPVNWHNTYGAIHILTTANLSLAWNYSRIHGLNTTKDVFDSSI